MKKPVVFAIVVLSVIAGQLKSVVLENGAGNKIKVDVCNGCTWVEDSPRQSSNCSSCSIRAQEVGSGSILPIQVSATGNRANDAVFVEDGNEKFYGYVPNDPSDKVLDKIRYNSRASFGYYYADKAQTTSSTTKRSTTKRKK